MQNLREAILSYRRGCAQEMDEKQRAQQLQRGVEYLERYWTLVAFAAYLHDPAWTASADAEADGSFHQWVTRRPELQSCLSRLLWRNPLAALSSAQTSVPDGDAAAEAVVMSRNGAVLTAHCILKVSEQAPPGARPCASANKPALPGRTVSRCTHAVAASAARGRAQLSRSAAVSRLWSSHRDHGRHPSCSRRGGRGGCNRRAHQSYYLVQLA